MSCFPALREAGLRWQTWVIFACRLPDRRQHRGPHPQDQELFHARQTDALAKATRDLSWLLSRGYSETSALALVGDRYSLRARQRQAVSRSACSGHERVVREQHRVGTAELRGSKVAIDGFNVLITLESWLGGAVLLRGRDGAVRDMASVHGSYRNVEETTAALQLLFGACRALGVASVECLLDSPVSNSGRLAGRFRELALVSGVTAEVDCVADPDTQLVQTGCIVLSSDRWILQRSRWFDLPAWLLECECSPPAQVTSRLPTETWLLDLGRL